MLMNTETLIRVKIPNSSSNQPAGDEMQKPSKEVIRNWMTRDRKKDNSKQTVEEIRRQLGWFLTNKGAKNV